jgi:hypothetical protein
LFVVSNIERVTDKKWQVSVEMAAVVEYQENRITVEDTTVDVTVPPDDYLHLCYYLNCVRATDCPNEIPSFVRGYASMKSKSEKKRSLKKLKKICDLCKLYPPKKVERAGFFIQVSSSVLEGHANRFIKVTAQSTNLSLLATESLAFAMLRDQKKSVEVMFCEESWLDRYFHWPLERIKRIVKARSRPLFIRRCWLYRLLCLTAVWLLFIPLIGLSFMTYLKARGFPDECLGMGRWYYTLVTAVVGVVYVPFFLTYLMRKYYRWEHRRRKYKQYRTIVIGMAIFLIVAIHALYSGNQGRKTPNRGFEIENLTVKCTALDDWLGSSFLEWADKLEDEEADLQGSIDDWMSTVHKFYFWIFMIMIGATVFWGTSALITCAEMCGILDLERY